MRARRASVLTAALALAMATCGRGDIGQAPRPTAEQQMVVAINATTAPLLPTNVLELPAVTPGTYEALLSQLRGTPVLVNMWGSWCPPCRDEAPMLAAAHAEFGERVQFLGIDIEDDRAGAVAFIREFAWRFPSVVDPAFPSRLRSTLGFLGQPNTLFYDASGEVVSTWQGPLTQAALRKGIAAILADA